MRARRLIGGFVVAVIVAVAMTQTAEAFYVDYCNWAWWSIECWF